MRILITSDIFPPDVGGPATYVPRIASELAKLGHQVTVVTYTLAPQPADGDQYPFRVVRVPAAPPQVRRFPRTLYTIWEYAKEADVIYANGLVTETALVNTVLRRPLVAKVVGDLAWERCRDKGWLTDDIDPFQTKRYSWKVELMRWRRNWSYRRMDSIIVPSEYLKQMLTEHWGLPAKRVRVIYNSFEGMAAAEGSENQHREVARVEIGLAARYLLITVCRLTGWKGVDGLIRALPELGPEVGLVIVGDGPLYGELTALAGQLGVSDRARFLGAVPRDRVAALLRACDLFVLNSTYEGLPHVVLEAASAGLPVIATDAGGTREVVSDLANAQLIPVGNSAQLVEAVRTWIARLPVQPAPIPERFSLRHMIEATEAELIHAGSEARP